MLKGNPCKVIETAISKPGKHGSAKIHVLGMDIFTNKKIDDIFSTAETAWTPNVKKT
jgi:translation initiation factor 5A